MQAFMIETFAWTITGNYYQSLQSTQTLCRAVIEMLGISGRAAAWEFPVQLFKSLLASSSLNPKPVVLLLPHLCPVFCSTLLRVLVLVLAPSSLSR